MRKSTYIRFKITSILALLIIVAASCERDLSDKVEFATFPSNADIFIDGFSGGLDYNPFGGSKLDAFSVDEEVSYKGTASMRLDIPNFGDPDGAYAGAIFPDAAGRDLSGYDALTFWAKASQAATINAIGFGNDFDENKYLVTKTNLRISTNWKKYVIPFPDPSKLTFEKGMFWYAEGPENNNGYSIWIDELKFEKLGTIAQPRPAIFNGEDIVDQRFVNTTSQVTGLTQTFNLGSGVNETVIVAPSYFTFKSSNIEVARVSELGEISIIGTGTAKITATLANVAAAGSLTIEVLGSLEAAPIPIRDQSNVISLFSNVYNDVTVDTFNPFFQFSTTQNSIIDLNGDDIISYTDLNFVAILTESQPINAANMSHLHLDIYTPDAPAEFKVELRDYGANGVFDQAGDDSQGVFVVPSSQITTNQWISLDIPLSSFTGLTAKQHVAQLVLSGGLPNVYVDNIYFYTE